jgi:hypothetical protein
MEQSESFLKLLQTLTTFARWIGLVPLSIHKDNTIVVKKIALSVSVAVAICFLVYDVYFNLVIFVLKRFFWKTYQFSSDSVLYTLIFFFMCLVCFLQIEFLVKTYKKVIILLHLFTQINTQLLASHSAVIRVILLWLIAIGYINIFMEHLPAIMLVLFNFRQFNSIYYTTSFVHNDIFSLGVTLFTLTLQLIAASFFKSANSRLKHWQQRETIAEPLVEKLRLVVRSVFDAVELIQEIVQSSYVCLLCARNINIQLSLFTVLQVLYGHILGLEAPDNAQSVMLLRDFALIILQFLVPHFLEAEVGILYNRLLIM